MHFSHTVTPTFNGGGIGNTMYLAKTCRMPTTNFIALSRIVYIMLPIRIELTTPVVITVDYIDRCKDNLPCDLT